MGCAPYRHPFFITAQVLSIIAFLMSITWWLAIILGLAALIMLQVCWCCKMNRCGLITAGVFACIAAIANIITGLFILANESTLYCGYDDDYYTTDCSYVPAAIVTFIGAVLWIITAVGVFVFTCKIDKYRDEDDNRNMKQQQQPNITINVPYGAPGYPQETAVPSRQATREDSYYNDEEQHASTSVASTSDTPNGMSFFRKKQPPTPAPVDKNSPRASSTKIVTEVGKDGSKKITKTVTNPDGSQDITIMVEEAVTPAQACLDPCGAFNITQ